MLRLLYIYFRTIVAYNLGRIITLELLLGIGVGALYLNGALTTEVLGRNVGLNEFVTHAVTISGIGLGACLTAVTMAVRLADPEFADYLASDLPSLSIKYEAVLFNLSWTALISLLTTVLGTATLLFAPLDAGMFDPGLATGWKVVAATLIGLLLYGVMMLFATVLSIAIVGMQRFEWRYGHDHDDQD
jgi:hypothetical protein